MATRQYIGARYVPKFYQNSVDGSTQWEANVVYDPLIYVTLTNGHMYISKKQVPATVGTPASNIEYWLDIGSINGFVEELQEDVNALETRVDNINDNLEVITPEFFGAVGNGVTDDTTALQNAVNSAKIVYLSNNKTYLISTLNVPAGHSIIGSGTIKLYATSMINGIILNGKNEIRDINITDGYTTLATDYCAIYGNESDHCTIKNVKFNDIHLGYCIRFDKSDFIAIEYNDIAHYSYAGIMLINGCRYSDVCHNTVYDGRINYQNRYPISISGYETTADRCADHIKCNYNVCVDLTAVWEGIDSHGCNNCEFIGNTITGVRTGIMLTNPTTPLPPYGFKTVSNVIVANNVINVDGGTSLMSGGIIISPDTSETADYIVIKNNIIKCTNNTGAHTSVVAGIGLRKASFKHVVIDNNTVDNTASGILLGNCSDVIISNNECYNMASANDHGISLTEATAMCYNVVVENNNIHDVIRSFRGSSVASIVEYKNNIDNGVYETSDYATVPKAALNNSLKALGKRGAFVPSTTGNEAGWLCVSANTWLTIAGTAV